MKRSDLEHIIRAAGAIAKDGEVVVVGSQSILGAIPNPPAELAFSMEADVYPRNNPHRSDLIDGAIGEHSLFHKTFGYYAQGVGPETAILPQGWQSRLVPVSNRNTDGTTGLCLDVHDLAVSKYVAGREKDLEFTRALATHGFVEKERLLKLLEETAVAPDIRRLARARIQRHFQAEPEALAPDPA